MARINIEDQFWVEVSRVAAKLGNEHLAIGMAVQLFRIAQERAKHGRIVSDSDWVTHEFSDALIPTFAEKVDGGYRVRGTGKHFGWLKDRVDAGKKGGSTPRKNKDLGEANESKRKQAEASCSLSSSSSYSGSNSISHSQDSISTVAEKSAPMAVVKLSDEISFSNEQELINAIPQNTKDRWSRLYPDSQYVFRETLKAFNYYETNPTKKPKVLRGWVRALGSWYERGWPRHQKSIQATQPGFSDHQMQAILGGDEC